MDAAPAQDWASPAAWVTHRCSASQDATASRRSGAATVVCLSPQGLHVQGPGRHPWLRLGLSPGTSRGTQGIWFWPCWEDPFSQQLHLCFCELFLPSREPKLTKKSKFRRHLYRAAGPAAPSLPPTGWLIIRLWAGRLSGKVCLEVKSLSCAGSGSPAGPPSVSWRLSPALCCSGASPE